MKKKNEKGFFVIETIVVIAIVALVITYIFTNFSNTYNRFILSETYNNIGATNAVLNLKKYVDDSKIDYDAALGTEDLIELSSIPKLSTEYYNYLKDYLNIKTAYLINVDNFFADSNNMTLFDVKYQKYLDTLSNIKSKYIIVIGLEDSSYGYISIYNYTLDLVGNSDEEYAVYTEVGTEFIDPGFVAEDKNGNKLDVFVTGVVDTNTAGIYYLMYTLQDITVRRKVVVYEDIYDFAYTGSYQVFKAPIAGTYRLELWGAQGGRSAATTYAGNGGYTKGEVYLNENDILYVYVGQQGTLGTPGVAATSTVGQGAPATFNGGGGGGNAGGGAYPYQNYSGGPSGGGASDIRTVSGIWNDTNSLRSRLIVAAGGGGSVGNSNYDSSKGNAGGLSGQAGGLDSYLIGTYEADVPKRGVGATQTTGYAFGLGGRGADTGNPSYCNGHGGGGGGYYGGTGAQSTGGNCHYMGGGSGSSFISGFTGVNAIRADGTPSGLTKHFSGYVFSNTTMKSGIEAFLSPLGVSETGHSGNGYARITLLTPETTNTLSNVRYIYNEMNGSSVNGNSHWVELQAYDINGINVSQGITTITKSNPGVINLNYLTNGNITTTEYIEGGLGVSYLLLDLGQEYDLSSIRLWHYYADGRTYHDNIVRVAGRDEQFITVLDEEYPETSYGKVIRPESLN